MKGGRKLIKIKEIREEKNRKGRIMAHSAIKAG
jgi:hypothetical protein